MLSGSLRTSDRTVRIEDGRLSGTVITFRVGDTGYRGRVTQGDEANQTTMRGVARTPDGVEDWQATRVVR